MLFRLEKFAFSD